MIMVYLLSYCSTSRRCMQRLYKYICVTSNNTFMKDLKIKFEVSKEDYNTDFIAKIEESRKQAKAGKTVKIALDDIWK